MSQPFEEPTLITDQDDWTSYMEMVESYCTHGQKDALAVSHDYPDEFPCLARPHFSYGDFGTTGVTHIAYTFVYRRHVSALMPKSITVLAAI